MGLRKGTSFREVPITWPRKHSSKVWFAPKVLVLIWWREKYQGSWTEDEHRLALYSGLMASCSLILTSTICSVLCVCAYKRNSQSLGSLGGNHSFNSRLAIFQLSCNCLFSCLILLLPSCPPIFYLLKCSWWFLGHHDDRLAVCGYQPAPTEENVGPKLLPSCYLLCTDLWNKFAPLMVNMALLWQARRLEGFSALQNRIIEKRK